jgi:hypothetical protein
MCAEDFPVYSSLQAVPPAYFSPYLSWINKQDLVEYTQGRLERGYYLICSKNGNAPDDQSQGEILSSLRYGNSVLAGEYFVLSKLQRFLFLEKIFHIVADHEYFFLPIVEFKPLAKRHNQAAIVLSLFWYGLN